MLMLLILRLSLRIYHQSQMAWTASAVDPDAKPSVLSSRVQMESHPHLSLKGKKDGRHQAHKAALTGKYGGSIKRDAVLTGGNVVNVDYLLSAR